MNLYVQIAAGFLPAVLLLTGYLLWARKHWAGVFCALFLIGGAGISCGWMIQNTERISGNWKNTEISLPKEEEEKEVSYQSAFQLAYGLAAAGETDEAFQTIREVVEEQGYTPQAALARARVYGVRGDFKAAAALYAKAEEEGALSEEEREEYEGVLQAAQSQRTDWILAAAYPDQDIPVQGSPEDSERGAELILNYLEENGNQEGAKAARQVSQLYDQFLNTGACSQEELAQAEERLEDLRQEEGELFSLKSLRDAKIKADILNRDYQQITRDITRDSDSSQLMIGMELYLEGYVDERDFSDQYGTGSEEELDAVIRQPENIRREPSGSLPQEAELLKEEYARYQEGGPIYQLEQDLLQRAVEEDGGDSSKIYLQMAKLELSRDDEEKAREYMGQAFDTAGDSDDGDYGAPMLQMISLIGEKEDAESLKDMALYARSALDHQLDVKIPSADPERQEEFQQYVTDQAVKDRVAVNITDLDASGFETVTAEFQFDAGESVEDIRDQIKVEDCGVEITDYQLEKIQYDSARMLLCCDVSGSMAGQPIEDLKAAVGEMANSASGDISLAVVTFNSTPSVLVGFTRDGQQIADAADQMSSGGGTNVYQGIMTSFEQFLSNSKSSMDYIVVLSDGQSSDPKSYEEVLADITAAAQEKGVFVYSLGLGDGVDANYLESIAKAAGGTYAYVTSSETLASFYQDLETRKDCSYRITYQAVDTLSVSRTLRISDRQEEYRYDERRYYLNGAGQETEGEDQLVFGQGVSVRGLDTRFLFRSSNPQQVCLLGSGFRENQEITVELKGDRNYTLEAEYGDEGTYHLTIPGSPACGTYHLYVRIGGRLAVLDRELTIAAPEDERTVDFGPYRFTSYQRIQGDGFVEMDGYVTLNSWLHFKGKVRLDGDLAGTSITLTDAYGSYIQYEEGSSLGLAQLMLKNNEVMAVPSLGQLTLYNDNMHKADSDEYRVDYGSLPYLYPSGIINLSTPGYALYPYKIKLDFVRFSAVYPQQEEILKVQKDFNLFDFEVEKAEGILTGDNIGIILEAKANQGSNREVNAAFFKLDTPIQLSGAVRVDTVKNSFGFDFGIKLPLFQEKTVLGSTTVGKEESQGLNFSADWKEKEGRIVPDRIAITLGLPLNTTIGTVPVTFDNFSLKVENMNGDRLNETYLEGAVDISVAKVAALVPPLEPFVGKDMAAVTFKDTHLGFSAAADYINMGTTVMLLGHVDIGALTLEVGHIPYSSQILGMESEYVNGAIATAEIGPDWESDHITIKLRVSSQLALTDRVLGLTGTGECDLAFELWVFYSRMQASGQIFIGFYTDHDNQRMFLIRFRDSDSPGENKIDVAWKMD